MFIYCKGYEENEPTVVWLRIVNVIKQWVTKNFDFWQSDPTMCSNLLTYLQDIVLPTLSKQSSIILPIIEKIQVGFYFLFIYLFFFNIFIFLEN